MDHRDTFLRLFLAHELDLKAFIASLVRKRSAADDVFQETALVLWRKFDAYDRSRPFGAWARGVAHKEVLRQRTRAGRSRVLFSSEALEAILESWHRTEPRLSDRRDALDQCVDALPDRSRRLVTLRYGDALKLREVADAVGRQIDAVHKALSRLREGLRDCIERRLRLGEQRG